MATWDWRTALSILGEGGSSKNFLQSLWLHDNIHKLDSHGSRRLWWLNSRRNLSRLLPWPCRMQQQTLGRAKSAELALPFYRLISSLFSAGVPDLHRLHLGILSSCRDSCVLSASTQWTNISMTLSCCPHSCQIYSTFTLPFPRLGTI